MDPLLGINQTISWPKLFGKKRNEKTLNQNIDTKSIANNITKYIWRILSITIYITYDV